MPLKITLHETFKTIYQLFEKILSVKILEKKVLTWWHFSAFSFYLENLPELLPDLSTELQLDQIHLNGLHESSVSIIRITLQTQVIFYYYFIITQIAISQMG